VADVALFYGERSGGIRSYLDAKVRQLQGRTDVEHHVLVPGPAERHDGGRHELPALRVPHANGYRLPLGARALERSIAALAPDVVLLHDPFWAPRRAAAAAHRSGARVVTVHHGSAELDAAGLRGPQAMYVAALRLWLRHAYRPADAVMSVVDPRADCGRPAALPLRLGLDEAFRPPRGVARGDETLYVGRLAREKGVFRLLDAAARSQDLWPLRFIGAGPAENALRARAGRLGIGHRVAFSPFIVDRARLARRYAAARCVVVPGEHETFGLVVLEAAASGARVVCCETAPARAQVGDLAHTFRAGDAGGLAAAVTAARAAEADPAAAAAVALGHGWPRLFAQELEDLRALLRRSGAHRR
jgi:alpha-1,6-mannosyltransferase